MVTLNHEAWGRRQYGAATLDQLGVYYSRSQVSRMVKAGVIRRSQPRVYEFSVAPDSLERRHVAAILSAQPAWASHRSAAWLWQLGDEVPPVPEIVVPPSSRPRLHNVIVHRSQDVETEPMAVVRGIPVTNPSLTLLHLGAVRPFEDVQRAVNKALARRLVDLDDLERFVDRVSRSGKTGAGTLREVLACWHRGGPLESELERRFLDLVRAAGLPEPEFQFEVRLDGGRVVRIDVAWPELGLAVELDGFFVHGSPVASELDQVRQLALNDLGWHVERFSWALVVKHPELVAKRLRALIRQLAA